MSAHADRRADLEAVRVLEELEKFVAARRGTSPEPDVRGSGPGDRPGEPNVVGPRHSGRALGALLVTRGFLMDHELQHALSLQKQSGERLGEILVRLGLLSDTDLVQLLAEQLRMPTINLDRITIDGTVARLISIDEARSFGVLPVRRSNEYIDVVIADPTDERTAQFLAVRLGAPIRLCVATRAGIDAAIDGLTHRHTSV